MKFSLAKLFEDVNGSRVVTKTDCKNCFKPRLSFHIVVEAFWTLAFEAKIKLMFNLNAMSTEKDLHTTLASTSSQLS